MGLRQMMIRADEYRQEIESNFDEIFANAKEEIDEAFEGSHVVHSQMTNSLASFLESDAVGAVKHLIEKMPSGHSKFHLQRDFIASCCIYLAPEERDFSLLLALFAGTFHDIGRTLVLCDDLSDKYSPRHAELGAILLYDLLEGDLPPNFLKLVFYCVAGHTQYLEDNQAGIKPYRDDFPAMRLTRMVDRIDCNGAVMLIRAAIFEGLHAKTVSFKPTLDEKTVFSHLYMFASSQTNLSLPYFTGPSQLGKYLLFQRVAQSMMILEKSTGLEQYDSGPKVTLSKEELGNLPQTVTKRFEQVGQAISPGSDWAESHELILEKFQELTESELLIWMQLLTDVLYYRQSEIYSTIFTLKDLKDERRSFYGLFSLAERFSREQEKMIMELI